MKKISIALLTILALSACGTAATTQEQVTTQTPDGQSSVEPVDESKRVQSSPTLADGDIYLEALGKKDAQMCLKIGSQSLREKCTVDLK